MADPDYTVVVTLHDNGNDPPTLTFSTPNGEVNVKGLSQGSKTIEFKTNGDPGALAFTFVAIKIAASESGLATAPQVSSGDYPGPPPFDDITLGSSDTTLTLTDFGTVDELWYYCLGVRYNGTDYWPDPKIYNETSGGPTIKSGLVFGSG